MSGKEEMKSVDAYKELIGLLKTEDTLTWSRFQTFLTVNAGLLVLLGLAFPRVLAEGPRPAAVVVLALCLCAVGITTAFLWLFVAGRSEAFYDHWFDQLQYYEKERLEGVSIFNTAEEYFKCSRAFVGSRMIELKGHFKTVRIFTASKIIALLMAGVWSVLLVTVVVELLTRDSPAPPSKVEIRIQK